MEPSELLGHCVSVLERLGIRYLVTGAIATIYYGEPRFTNEIDIVIDLIPATIVEFCRAFPWPAFYLSEEAVRQAVETRTQFNIIHPASGLKVDMMIPPDTPFNRSRFVRAVRVRPVPEYEATFASVEDVIIKKLEYYREGGSDKHLRDVIGVLKIEPDRVDVDYVSEWAKGLGLESIWDMVCRRAAE